MSMVKELSERLGYCSLTRETPCVVFMDEDSVIHVCIDDTYCDDFNDCECIIVTIGELEEALDTLSFKSAHYNHERNRYYVSESDLEEFRKEDRKYANTHLELDESDYSVSLGIYPALIEFLA